MFPVSEEGIGSSSVTGETGGKVEEAREMTTMLITKALDLCRPQKSGLLGRGDRESSPQQPGC